MRLLGAAGCHVVAFRRALHPCACLVEACLVVACRPPEVDDGRHAASSPVVGVSAWWVPGAAEDLTGTVGTVPPGGPERACGMGPERACGMGPERAGEGMRRCRLVLRWVTRPHAATSVGAVVY